MHLTYMTMTQNGEIKTIGGFRPEALLRVLEETNVSAFVDQWGPSEVQQVYDSDTGMQGVLVIDNTTLGPGCGGIRISLNTTPREAFQRARMMTLSAALVQVDLGGAAAGIRADPAVADKGRLIRAFAKSISAHVPDQYIACPDQSTGQTEMKIFAHEVGDLLGAVGKPIDMGGVPHELGVVGFGIGLAVESCLNGASPSRTVPPSLNGIRIAIQGFDHTGAALVKYLEHKGARIIAVSDDWGAVHDPNGLDVERLLKHSSAPGEKQSLAGIKGIPRSAPEAIAGMDCDLLVLTGESNLVNELNVSNVKARCVAEGTHFPLSPLTDQALTRQGVLVVPDILTLSGGVVGAFNEYKRNSCETSFAQIEYKVRDAAGAVIQRVAEQGLTHRRAAIELAKERLLEALEVMG